VCDISRLDFIPSGTVEEIYASHVLEHFRYRELPRVLHEWNRLLQPGGVLRLAVPDFAAVVERYRETGSLNGLQGLLYGGQTYDYNFHHVAFDLPTLEALLVESGFTNVRRYRWQEFLPPGYDDFSRAYIPHMDFENGRLMSLNVAADKP
jgi:ubiquinone/menaquinone biosynthesis C-methylase UbiE